MILCICASCFLAAAFSPEVNHVAVELNMKEREDSNKVLVRVIEYLIDRGPDGKNSRNVTDVTVRHDGTFTLCIPEWERRSDEETLQGRLSPEIVGALKEDLLVKEKFHVVDQIPTYRFSGDMAFTLPPPKGIRKLLKRLTEIQ
jgi:hypothetical protein